MTSPRHHTSPPRSRTHKLLCSQSGCAPLSPWPPPRSCPPRCVVFSPPGRAVFPHLSDLAAPHPHGRKSPPLLPRLRLPHAARARHCFSTVSCFHAFLAGLPGERGARHRRLRAEWRLRPLDSRAVITPPDAPPPLSTPASAAAPRFFAVTAQGTICEFARPRAGAHACALARARGPARQRPSTPLRPRPVAFPRSRVPGARPLPEDAQLCRRGGRPDGRAQRQGPVHAVCAGEP